VALDEFAVAFRVAAPHGRHGGFVLLRAAGHFDWHHLTARQPRREIVTARRYLRMTIYDLRASFEFEVVS
jgi:hypothetical protein